MEKPIEYIVRIRQTLPFAPASLSSFFIFAREQMEVFDITPVTHQIVTYEHAIGSGSLDSIVHFVEYILLFPGFVVEMYELENE